MNTPALLKPAPVARTRARVQNTGPRVLAQTRIHTPLGPLLLTTTAQGLAGAWFDDQAHHPGTCDAPEDPAHPVLRATALAFQCYWDKGAQAAAQALHRLALDPQGTPFQQAVWRALLAIPPGQTTHYGAIAQGLGRPEAARAVGAAVGRNPIAVLVPCHRVLGRDGSLTGYAGGLPRKQALLKHEGVQLAATTPDLFGGPTDRPSERPAGSPPGSSPHSA